MRRTFTKEKLMTEPLQHFKPVKFIPGIRAKLIDSDEKLAKIADGLKAAEHKIVVTIGTWDELHTGHIRYLESAASQGNVLIVGVDTDATVQKYKHRDPIFPFDQRWEMLTQLRSVDYVVPIDDVVIDKKTKGGIWQYGILKIVRPDVYVAVVDSYRTPQLHDIRRHVGQIIVLDRHASTSTTAVIKRKESMAQGQKKKTGGKKK
jgi:cytidyltransferase-like protein